MEHSIKVKAFPDAKKEFFQEIAPYQVRIFVREPAKNNLANKKVLELIASFYNIPRNNLRMVSGHRSNHKTVIIKK